MCAKVHECSDHFFKNKHGLIENKRIARLFDTVTRVDSRLQMDTVSDTFRNNS